RRKAGRLKLARHFLNLEAFDEIPDLDVVVIFERHTAFHTGANLSHLILEAFKGRERAFVNDDVIAQQTYLRAALDVAFGDQTAGNLADLLDIEDFANFRIAEKVLAERRRQHARKHRPHVIDDVIDHRVILDIDALKGCLITRLLVGAGIERDHYCARCSGKRNIRFGNPANARIEDLDRNLVGAEILERVGDGLRRALNVRLDDDRQLIHGAVLDRAEHLFDGAARGCRDPLVLVKPLTVGGNLSRLILGFGDDEIIACRGCTLNTEYFDRDRRARFRDILAAIIEQGADL